MWRKFFRCNFLRVFLCYFFPSNKIATKNEYISSSLTWLRHRQSSVLFSVYFFLDFICSFHYYYLMIPTTTNIWLSFNLSVCKLLCRHKHTFSRWIACATVEWNQTPSFFSMNWTDNAKNEPTTPHIARREQISLHELLFSIFYRGMKCLSGILCVYLINTLWICDSSSITQWNSI